MVKRWRKIVLVIFFLIFGLANLIRAGMVPYVAPFLADWDLSIPLSFLGGLYLIWGIVFIALAIMTWLERGRRWIFPIAITYQLNLWAISLLFVRSPYARSLWFRDLLLSCLFLGFIVVLKPGK